MQKVVLFLIAACVIVAIAWLLAGVPGHVVASIGTITVQASTPMTILTLIAIVVLILVLVRIVRSIIAIPRVVADRRQRIRHARGETSVTRVLVALAAGQQGEARKEARRARRLLGDSPQILLLTAEAGRLSGREDEAAEAFRALAKQKDARFLGLRGLLRQAVDRQDWSEALVVAKQAEASHPGTVWLRQQRAELALQTENWPEALELIGPDPRRPTYYVAAADAEADPSRSMNYAKQAWNLDPAFQPAALAYASRLRTAGQEKRARSCIADTWKRAPHPDLAAFLLATDPDKAARARSVKILTSANPNNLESRILLARVSLEAGLPGEARHQVEAAEKEGFNQRRLCLLLAEIEEQEHGDTEEGRLSQRNALRRAATADPDPNWQCSNCHTDHTAWHPKCGTCGSISTIQWTSTARFSPVPVLAA